MLASLRPHSPSGFDSRHRSDFPAPGYRDHPMDDAHHGAAPQRKGSVAERYSPPLPSRAAPPPHMLEPSSYASGAGGQDHVEQRPSPQTRQRSWLHHPYMQSSRSSHGPSPPVPLDSLAGPSSRAYEHGTGTYIGHMADPKHRSPPNRSELLHAAHEPRHRAGSRGDIYDRAQPLNILPRPAHPQDLERVGGIGPNRNRGRSNTLSLPHPETTRRRGGSFVGTRRHSPSLGAHSAYDEPVPPPPRSWEDPRPIGLASHPAADPLSARRHSPTFRPSSRQSPLLFAPLSPRQDPLPQAPMSRGAGPMPTKLANPGMMPRGAHYRSRPGTPVSPLNMDSLSMEDTAYPSASGLAAPLPAGLQRSPMDRRGRNDYFDTSPQWGRPSELAASPQFAHYPPPPPPLRRPSRDHLYRAGAMLHPDDVSSDAEMQRYHASAHPAVHPALHSGRGSVGSLPAHAPRTAADQMERERFAMAQHHAHAQAAGFPAGPGGPPDYGYQSEFAPQQRMGPGGGFAGYPPQHAVPVDRIAHSRRRRRPPYSYSSMITQAIASSSEGRMTLREIYTWISSNFSGYPMSGPDSQGWQNTVRHNLSLGKIFIKKARTAQDIYDSCSSGNPSQSQAARGKGGWWTLHPVVLSQIRSGQRTHNDEFDDIERLVELENAAASTADAKPSSAAMVATSSAASVDESGEPRRSSAELVRDKTLTRQRSYSDSMDATTAEQRRPGSSHQAAASTAPVSRKVSIDVGLADRAPRAQAAQGVESASPQDMPSVLQGTTDFAAEDKAATYNRMRGHTIGVHDQRARREGEHYTRPGSNSVSVHRPVYQARPQTAGEDVEMQPSPRNSSLILQEARETLVSAQQQRAAAAAPADMDDGAGRMAIRGLLNS